MSFKINMTEYKEMVTAIKHFKTLYSRYPNYYTFKNRAVRIDKKDYNDAINRVANFEKQNKRLPQFVIINNEYKVGTGQLTPQIPKPKIWLDMEDSIGKFNTIREFYNQLGKKKYKYYYNDVYPQKVSLQRLKKNSGLNCADISQLVYSVLGAMGYKATYWRGKFNCGGHIWVTYNTDKHNVNVFDGAAAFKGIKLGQWLCSGTPIELVKNPAWLLSDDGIT